MTNPAALAPRSFMLASRRLAVAGSLTLAGLSLALSVGCSDYSHQIASDVRSDPTPELMTLWERPVDVKNHLAVVRNANFRMMWQDLGRATLLDHPSRMTWEPMPR